MTSQPTGQQQADDQAIQILSNEGAQCGDCGDQPGDRICPNCERCRSWYVAALRKAGWAPQPERDALAREVRRLRAAETVLATLADRWQEMADNGDHAIGHFDGPAAATLDAEVGERGRTYRKAADDVREVLASGRIPHDLMTTAQLDAAAGPSA